MFPKSEYEHSDDYDPVGAEWIDHTRFGSTYQEQLDLRSQKSHWRHRDFFARGPWKEGPAPD